MRWFRDAGKRAAHTYPKRSKPNQSKGVCVSSYYDASFVFFLFSIAYPGLTSTIPRGRSLRFPLYMYNQVSFFVGSGALASTAAPPCANKQKKGGKVRHAHTTHTRTHPPLKQKDSITYLQVSNEKKGKKKKTE